MIQRCRECGVITGGLVTKDDRGCAVVTQHGWPEIDLCPNCVGKKPQSNTLSQYIRTHSCKGFKPVPHYNSIGNFIEAYWEDDRCYDSVINEQLTLCRSIITGRVVGVKIYGIKQLIEPKLQHPETMCGFPVVIDHNFKTASQEIVFGGFEDFVSQLNFKLDELPLEVLLKFKDQIDARIKELENEQA